jgi:hypothetical protein
MLIPRTSTLIIGGACAVACAVAGITYVHNRETAVPAPAYTNAAYTNASLGTNTCTTPLNNTQALNTAPPPPSSQENFSQTAYPQGSVQQGYGYSNDGYYTTYTRPVYVRQAETAVPPVATEVSVESTGPATYARVRPVYYRERRHGRSKAKSAAIVAGSAGVGAAIGAIAGGGKGAAIGALAGGGAGFIYDRLTHNH